MSTSSTSDVDMVSSNSNSPPVYTNGSVTLVMSKDSVTNSTYDCDALGLHFRIYTSMELSHVKFRRVTHVYRWDEDTKLDVLVSEWENNVGSADRFGVRGLTGPIKNPGERPASSAANTDQSEYDSELVRVPRDSFLAKTGGDSLSSYGDRTFTAEDGKRYTWKIRPFSLMLYPAEGEDMKRHIAEYKRRNNIFNRRNAIIELQPEALEILNSLIVTFIYCEKARRNEEDAAAIAGVAS